MAKKSPNRTKEEMAAFFGAHDDFNDFISRKIMEEENNQSKEVMSPAKRHESTQSRPTGNGWPF